MKRMHKLPVAPASFFAMTLGLAETGNALRFAQETWGGSKLWGEWFEGLASSDSGIRTSFVRCYFAV